MSDSAAFQVSLRNPEPSGQDVAVIQLEGRLTSGDGITKLGDAVSRTLAKKVAKIVLDFESVTYVDSSGIGEVVRSAARARLVGGEIALANVNGKAKEVIGITGLNRLVDVYDSEDSAVAAIVGT